MADISQEKVELFMAAAKAAGSPPDQAARFLQFGYIPQPKQFMFHAACRLADVTGGPIDIGLGGARGPGKSHAIMAQIGMDDCQRVPGLKWLFLRKVQKAAKESFEDLIKRVFKGVPYKYTPSEHRLIFPNGSRIIIGGYKDNNELDGYLGIEYDGIAIEEATLLTEDKILDIKGSLRTSKDNWRVRMYYSTNPGNIGHEWFRTMFIVPATKHNETRSRFIFSNYTDNAFLNIEYIEYLEGLKGARGRAWRDGEWDAFEGQAFPEWDEEKHVITVTEFEQIKRANDFEHWVKWRAIDWGSAAPFCCLWFTKDPDFSREYVYREVYRTNLTVPQQARLILEMTPSEEKILCTYADPSMWARNMIADEVTSTADKYSEYGVPLLKADNDRLSGKRKVDELLADLPDGEPGIRVVESCENLIRTLPLLPRSDNNPEDVDTKAEDHCLIAGTLIFTNKGEKSIETIKTNDMVLTRKGYKKVIKSWLTQVNATVYKVLLSDGRTITGTAKHPIFIQRKGFISIDTLRYGDIILEKECVLWKLKLSNLTELSLGDTRTQRTTQAEHITHQAQIIDIKGLGSCIRKFGRVFTGLFQRAATFTTQITTRSTMIFGTLSAYQLTNIYQNILLSTYQARLTWPGSDHLQRNGINQKQVTFGTNYTLKTWYENIFYWLATIAEKSINLKCANSTIIAPLFVDQQPAAIVTKTISKKYAQFVEKYLHLINTIIKKLVLKNAVQVISVQKSNKPQDVYNLTVMDEHEFFANGVLVHNCYDSLKYGQTNQKITAHEPRKTTQRESPIARIF